MSGGKAALVSVVIMALMGVIIWCFWSYQSNVYYILVQAIALYGFVIGGIHIFQWLQKDGKYTEKNRNLIDETIKR